MMPEISLCRMNVQVSPFWYQGCDPKLLYQALVNRTERQAPGRVFPIEDKKALSAIGPASASQGHVPLTPLIVACRRLASPAPAGECLPAAAGRDASRPAQAGDCLRVAADRAAARPAFLPKVFPAGPL